MIRMVSYERGPLQHSLFSPTANPDDVMSLVNYDHDGTDPKKNI